MLAAVKTFLEFWHVQPKRFSILHQILRINGFLVLKDHVVHLPEFALVASTDTCFSCLECLLVESQRKVKEVVSDFPCVDIFFYNLRSRLTDVS